MIRRKIKNVVKNYSEIEILVREATSNESWGPSNSILVKIASLSSVDTNLIQIMPIIWKRLKDTGKNWRHVYKSLILLEFLITRGNPSVSDNCRQNIHFLQTLEKFIYDDNNVDVGSRIRKRAETLVRLLKDNDLLRSERNKAAVTDMRFSKAIISQGSNVPMKYGNGVSSLSQGPSTGSFTSNNDISNKDYIKTEYVVPSNLIEEDLQLQIALAESEEDAKQRQKAEDIEKLTDNYKLSMAMGKNLKENEMKEAPVETGSAKSEIWGNVAESNDPWSPIDQDGDRPGCQSSGDGWPELNQVPVAQKNWIDLEPPPTKWDSHFDQHHDPKPDPVDHWNDLGRNSTRSERNGNSTNHLDFPNDSTHWPGIEASTDSLWSDSTRDPWAAPTVPEWPEQPPVWPPPTVTTVDPWHSDDRALSIDPYCDPWAPPEPKRLVASSNPIPRKLVPVPVQSRDKSDSMTEFLASHSHLVQFDRLISGSPDFLSVLDTSRSQNGPVARNGSSTASGCHSNPFYEPPRSSNPFVSTTSATQLPESSSWKQSDWASIEALDNAIVLAKQAERGQWDRNLYDNQINNLNQAPSSVSSSNFNPFLI